MFTNYDEFIYHEMIVHPGMSQIARPKKALVIGGGDGGTLRELLRYKSLKKITLCEIDEKVCEVSKKYFPQLGRSLNDPKVDFRAADGFKFVKDCDAETYDYICVDSTDPVGPGEILFSEEFYAEIFRILSPKGLMVCQSESPWSEKDMLLSIHKNLIQAGFHLKPMVAPVLVYPFGYWSWTMASKIF